jgi:hypothetical protein
MMKTETVPRLARSLVLGALCLAALDTLARPPRARELCGVLQSIDSDARTLILTSDKRDRQLLATWKQDTKILKNWRFESVGALKEGKHPCVFYRSPFFGKPFVTKIILN